MNFWKNLSSLPEWKSAIEMSSEKPVLVLKHSTRCSISVMALDRFNRNWKPEDAELFTPLYLDLLSYREISNAIAADTGVEHQSPQAILLKDGIAVLSETHQAIRIENFRDKATEMANG
jgi:bacillithiol system protein YtxJ